MSQSGVVLPVPFLTPRTMPLEILPIDSAERWRDAVMALPAERRDIHYLPDYAEIYVKSHGYSPFLALYSGDGGYVLQPFMRRRLDALPFLADAPERETFTDLANAYGYGGPLSNASGDAARALGQEFAVDFATWCAEARIASEFCSLHPLLAPHQLCLVDKAISPQHVKEVVIVDLRLDEAGIAAGLSKGHRSSIAAARRSGARIIKVEPDAVHLAAFRAIYDATMERRRAAARWLLPADFFPLTVEFLGEARTTLLFGYVGDVLQCGCLLMHDFATAYYHFAGAFGEQRNSWHQQSDGLGSSNARQARWLFVPPHGRRRYCRPA